jgi:hypothetical protein
MHVTIGHVFDSNHNYKPNTLQDLANSKCVKYARHYQRQRLAFAPIVANTLGQFGLQTLFSYFGIKLIIKQQLHLDFQ